MERALPAPTTTLPRWLRVGLLTMAAIAILAQFAFLVGYAFWHVRFHLPPFDYPIFVVASRRLTDGTMYDWNLPGYIYPYSPVFAWVFVPFAFLGLWIWQAIHFLVILLIPTWPMRILILVSAWFWMDSWEGNVGNFFVVAGFWAVRGNRVGSWAFMALCLMIPKPIYLPVLVWMLWREPRNRLPFAVMLIVHSALVLASGYAFDWLPALIGAGHDMASPFNFMPSRFMGWWWWPIGLALAAWLVYRDHPGWATIPAALYGGLTFLWVPLFEPPDQVRNFLRALGLLGSEQADAGGVRRLPYAIPIDQNRSPHPLRIPAPPEYGEQRVSVIGRVRKK